jgi:hypothetical protein
MKNYQKFISHFALIRETLKNDPVSDSCISDPYYKRLGITDPEKIKQLEIKKRKEMEDRIELGLGLVGEYGSVYEIKDDVMRYISVNHLPPSDIMKRLQLPFKSIFIETEITKDDADIGVDKISGILITETSLMSKVEDYVYMKYRTHGMIFIVHYFCEDGMKVWIDEFKITLEDVKKEGIDIYYSDKKTSKFLRTFIPNFILFKNDPEVEEVWHERSEKNVKRRMQKGLSPLPSSRHIRVIGKLKVYMDRMSSGLQKGKWNHRAYIGGFYRTLRSDFFTHKKGQVIRVEPHIRGSGILLKRGYELSFEKNDDRKDRDTLDYKEIKDTKVVGVQI